MQTRREMRLLTLQTSVSMCPRNQTGFYYMNNNVVFWSSDGLCEPALLEQNDVGISPEELTATQAWPIADALLVSQNRRGTEVTFQTYTGPLNKSICH